MDEYTRQACVAGRVGGNDDHNEFSYVPAVLSLNIKPAQSNQDDQSMDIMQKDGYERKTSYHRSSDGDRWDASRQMCPEIYDAFGEYYEDKEVM
jgi:hypothetical protein